MARHKASTPTDPPAIVVPDQPTDANRAAILAALIAFNTEASGHPGPRPLAVLLQDPVTGKAVGGLWGRTAYDWLFVEMFVVPEPFRGQGLGSNILAQAETIARARGCIGVWLDTYAFQAPDFYAKRGYEQFGTIEDHPRGMQRLFFKKRLT
jgi:GNAT superfamily N-acetyltransferase